MKKTSSLLTLFILAISVPVSQAGNLGRWSGARFIVEDSKIAFHVNRGAGGQLDYLYNKATQTQYLRGNGFYYLAGTGADSFGGNYYQSYDGNSNFRIIENTSGRCVVEVAGNLVRPPNYGGAPLGVAYLRRYTYNQGSSRIAVNHAVRFDADVKLNQLSATMDCDEDVGCNIYSWAPTEYWMGAGRSWVRFSSTGTTISDFLGWPNGFAQFDNLGRMFLPARARLANNSAALLTNNRRGGVVREFENPANFQDITFWTNPRSVSLHAKSLEAHFLNTDARYVMSRNGSSFFIRRGTVLSANESLRVQN